MLPNTKYFPTPTVVALFGNGFILIEESWFAYSAAGGMHGKPGIKV